VRRALLAALVLSLAAPALAQKAVLKTNEYLKPNEYLVAGNKAFFAVMQGDGNFCVYRGSGPSDNKGHVYCLQSERGPGRYFAILQADGNFCVYRGSGPTDMQGAVACIGPHGDKAPSFLIMQDDGNLALYRGIGPEDNKGYLWGSGDRRLGPR